MTPNPMLRGAGWRDHRAHRLSKMKYRKALLSATGEEYSVFGSFSLFLPCAVSQHALKSCSVRPAMVSKHFRRYGVLSRRCRVFGAAETKLAGNLIHDARADDGKPAGASEH